MRRCPAVDTLRMPGQCVLLRRASETRPCHLRESVIELWPSHSPPFPKKSHGAAILSIPRSPTTAFYTTELEDDVLQASKRLGGGRLLYNDCHTGEANPTQRSTKDKTASLVSWLPNRHCPGLLGSVALLSFDRDGVKSLMWYMGLFVRPCWKLIHKPPNLPHQYRLTEMTTSTTCILYANDAQQLCSSKALLNYNRPMEISTVRWHPQFELRTLLSRVS